MPSTPTRAPERPFNVGDALILIGAAAVGLVLVRGWREPNWCSYMIGYWPAQPASLPRRVHHEISVAVSWTIPFAMALTAAILLLRLRSPRPSIRRIVRQPGFVACAATLAAITLRTCQEVYLWFLAYLTRPRSAIHLPSPPFTRYDNPGFHPPPERWARNVLLESFPILVSPAVVVAIAVGWTVLRISGAGRPHAGWIDRSGRWLGWYWLGLGILLAVLTEMGKFLA